MRTLSRNRSGDRHFDNASLELNKSKVMPRTGILDSLSDEQKDQLFSWMESLPIDEVLNNVAAPQPDGFGIKTYVTSLRRFYQREKFLRDRDNLPLARMAHLNSEELGLLQSASNAALTQQLFQLIASPTQGHNHLNAASKWLLATKEQEIRLEKLKLARERFELDRQKLRLSAAFKQADCMLGEDANKIRDALHTVLEATAPEQ
jgi:hypothetical protein